LVLRIFEVPVVLLVEMLIEEHDVVGVFWLGREPFPLKEPLEHLSLQELPQERLGVVGCLISKLLTVEEGIVSSVKGVLGVILDVRVVEGSVVLEDPHKELEEIQSDVIRIILIHPTVH